MLGKKDKPAVETKEVVSTAEKPVAAKKKQVREVVYTDVGGGKAMVIVDGIKLKVKCYLRNADRATLIGVNGKSVEVGEWLAGKADL